MTDSRRKRLLMVDDHAAMGLLVTHIAAGLGFDVECFTKARDFLVALDRIAADVVVIDLAMPEMDGMELIGELAEQKVKAFVFVLSGFDRTHLDRAMILGKSKGLNMAGIISKPIRAAELRALLSQYAAPPVE